jgi:hypothetical protein
LNLLLIIDENWFLCDVGVVACRLKGLAIV